jgi:putative ABC transport system ATP-binding protein
MTALRITDLVFRWPRQAQILPRHCALRTRRRRARLPARPSGSGKSTLLGLLGGVALPQQGRIELLGTDITRLGSRARDRFRADHIGFLFQQFNLLPWLPALDNVLLPCTFSPRRRERAGADTSRRG